MPLSAVDFIWRCMHALIVSIDITWRYMHAFVSVACYIEVHICLCQW